MRDKELSLEDKHILITGVSRSMGIGAATAKNLAKAGAHVTIHRFTGYDKQVEYPDTDVSFTEELAKDLKKQGYLATALKSSDLSVKGQAEQVVLEAAKPGGYIDGMVLNHAYSTCVPIGQWTADHIDAHFNVNVRASMLMIQEFARQLPVGKDGSIVLFTSGQYLGPMVKEIAYAVSKEAVIGLCKQAATALAEQNIRVNCINPGATDTGYLSGKEYDQVAKMFLGGRWGVPEDAAKLVHFLLSDYAGWITGEVIASEGGFRRDWGSKE